VSPPAPSKIIAVHINFRGRAAQRGRLPAVPSYFQKPVSSIGRSGDSIVRPQGTELLGVEGEIAVIVGSRARHVTPEQGAAHVGWFAPANDVSLADMRWADRGSNLMAKGQDGYTPLGTPVEAATLPGGALTIRTRVNGEIVQEDSSENLIFDFGFLIADLSRFVTLEPGDVILTGTPAGAPVVQPGDEVEVELDGAGSVISHIVESPEPLGSFGAQPRLTVAARAQALGLAEHRSIELSADAREALRRVATATGDLLFSRAFAELAGSGSLESVRVLSLASSELAAGELMQRADAWSLEVSEERYLERCRLKTAVLFGAACELGAIQGGGASSDLGAFGERIGLAFQILDDILDVTGPPERTGKPQGADLLDGTVTLPLIIARSRDPELASLNIRSIRTPRDALPVCRRIVATGALSTARGRALELVAAAQSSLPRLPERQRAALELVAGGVVERYS